MVSQAKVKQDSDVCFFAIIMLSHPEVFVSVQCTVPKSWAHRSPTLHAKCSAMCSLSRSNNSSPRLRLKNWCVLLHRPSSLLFDGEDRTESDWVLTSCLTTSALFISGLASISSSSGLSSSMWQNPAQVQGIMLFFFRGWQLMVTRTLCPVASDDSFLFPPPPWGMTPLSRGKTSFFTSGV